MEKFLQEMFQFLELLHDSFLSDRLRADNSTIDINRKKIIKLAFAKKACKMLSNAISSFEQ